MRIALITDGIYPYVMGGMQKHSYFLAKYFALQKIEVDLYHYKPTNSTRFLNPFTTEELDFLNITEIDYPSPRKFPGHYLYERYLYSLKVWEVFKNRELPDFVYVKGFSGWALLKKRNILKKKIPVGVNFHGYEMFQQWPNVSTGIKLQILKQPVKYNISKADYVFSYGGQISDILKRLIEESKIIEVPTGIGTKWLKEESLSRADNNRKFIFVGRSERRKGIVELNTILATNSFTSMEFHFVGPIPRVEQIKRNNVFYHGAIQDQEELKALLDQMDILVCPSHSEGMPNVIIEGMARGLAIIATNVGAVNQMVDVQNGWLLEKSNIKMGLSTAIGDALKISGVDLYRKKKNSIEKVRQDFTWEKVIEKTIKKIAACINS